MTLPETEVLVLLGSNIAPEQNLTAAVAMLREAGSVLAVSSRYRTTPQGYADQPDFINMAVKLKTSLSPEDFKHQILDAIEKRLRRVRDPHNKNAPRTIDLDIALWGREILEYGEKPWHVPDADILRFAHVAVPLAEIAPEYVHPETGETLAQIAARFEASGIERLP